MRRYCFLESEVVGSTDSLHTFGRWRYNGNKLVWSRRTLHAVFCWPLVQVVWLVQRELTCIRGNLYASCDGLPLHDTREVSLHSAMVMELQDKISTKFSYRLLGDRLRFLWMTFGKIAIAPGLRDGICIAEAVYAESAMAWGFVVVNPLSSIAWGKFRAFVLIEGRSH